MSILYLYSIYHLQETQREKMTTKFCHFSWERLNRNRFSWGWCLAKAKFVRNLIKFEPERTSFYLFNPYLCANVSEPRTPWINAFRLYSTFIGPSTRQSQISESVHVIACFEQHMLENFQLIEIKPKNQPWNIKPSRLQTNEWHASKINENIRFSSMMYKHW